MDSIFMPFFRFPDNHLLGYYLGTAATDSEQCFSSFTDTNTQIFGTSNLISPSPFPSPPLGEGLGVGVERRTFMKKLVMYQSIHKSFRRNRITE